MHYVRTYVNDRKGVQLLPSNLAEAAYLHEIVSNSNCIPEGKPKVHYTKLISPDVPITQELTDISQLLKDGEVQTLISVGEFGIMDGKAYETLKQRLDMRMRQMRNAQSFNPRLRVRWDIEIEYPNDAFNDSWWYIY